MKTLFNNRLTAVLLVALITYSVQAGTKKLFEVKITTEQILSTSGNGEFQLYAGGKNYNVVDIVKGKMIMDKTYKDCGSSITKALDACFFDDKLVVSDMKTVCCIDLSKGKKLWEINSFVQLNANSYNSLKAFENYVFVSDKKQKENYTLTCLNLNNGKTLWTVENLKNKLQTGDILTFPDSRFVVLFVNEKPGRMRILNLETGENVYDGEFEGVTIRTLNDTKNGNVFLHHRVSDAISYVTAIDMKQGSVLWKTKTAHKSISTPQVLNTYQMKYYADMKGFDDKILLKTEGVEVFDKNTGKSMYSIPFVSYYAWSVGHYINAIFNPIITPEGILLADRTSGDLLIKMYDKTSGKLKWSTEKIKGTDCAPVAVLNENSVVIQFGGLCYYEVFNNGAIGKLLNPFNVISFDLQTGRTNWSKSNNANFYFITNSNDNIMIVGKGSLQTIDQQTGKTLKNENNPFGDDYFMTRFAINSTHKFQRDVRFDFSNRILLESDGKKLKKLSF